MNWDLLDALYKWVVFPLCGAAMLLGKKLYKRLSKLEKELDDIKLKQAVSEEQLKSLKEDYKDLVSVIREVEKTISLDIKVLQKHILDIFRRK